MEATDSTILSEPLAYERQPIYLDAISFVAMMHRIDRPADAGAADMLADLRQGAILCAQRIGESELLHGAEERQMLRDMARNDALTCAIMLDAAHAGNHIAPTSYAEARACVRKLVGALPPGRVEREPQRMMMFGGKK
jgi:hypothetical protein